MDQNEKKIVENSGILTHLKTVACLRKNGWTVNISPYYYDNVSDLIKEIDIIAEKQFNSADRHDSSVQVNVQLFIECKYVNHEIVFWFDSINKEKAVKRLEEKTDLRILYGSRMSADIGQEKFHYLQSETVAKLFSTSSNKEDLVYKAISQCLRSLVYHEQFVNVPIANEFREDSRADTLIVRYPMVVCDNAENLKEVEVNMGTSEFSTKTAADSFILETNYIYFNKAKSATLDDYFLIDFVSLPGLDGFLKTIEVEAADIVRAMTYKRA